MNRLVRLLRDEPAAITGIATAVYGVLQVFDVINWTDAQTGAVTVLAGAVMIFVRQLVKPVTRL